MAVNPSDEVDGSGTVETAAIVPAHADALRIVSVHTSQHVSPPVPAPHLTYRNRPLLSAVKVERTTVMPRAYIEPARRARGLLVTALLSLSVIVAASFGPLYAQVVRAASPARLLPSQSDISRVYVAGFKLDSARQTTNRDISVGIRTTGTIVLGGLPGRITGYAAIYHRRLVTLKGHKISTKPGVSLLLIGVNKYRNPAYARRAIRTMLDTPENYPNGVTRHVASLSGLGSSAVTIWEHTSAGGIPAGDSILISFQRNEYTAVVDATAFAGNPNRTAALILAHLLDARIRSAG